jgi:putative hydrolase of the HAD superfamily
VRWSGLIVFDLDDTLYLERDFVLSGFAAADRWFAVEYRQTGLEQACTTLFEQGRRGCVFDEALVGLGLVADAALVNRLVEIYRGHQPTIGLAEDAARFLAGRGDRTLHALVTDGPAATQQAKVRALGLEPLLGCIIYTDALGPGRGKPHPEAFERVEAWAPRLDLPLVYVADNPTKDFVTPRARGWLTVQVERPGRVHHLAAPDAAYAAHARIDDFDKLEASLMGLREAGLATVGTFPTDAHRGLSIS